MKNSQLQIRVSEAQKKSIQQAAGLENRDISSWVLGKLFKSFRVQFLEKINLLFEKPSERKYLLADLADFLTHLDSEGLREVLQTAWFAHQDPFLSNYIAAMLEFCAHQHQIPSGNTLSAIEPLNRPYFGTDLKNLRLYLLQASPPPFRARNIFIDTSLGGRV